jgi:FHA domain/Zinc-ribbon containing domain
MVGRKHDIGGDVAINRAPEVYETGRVVGTGSFVCMECDFPVVLEALDAVPECPSCGGSRFRRASLFEQPTVDSAAVGPDQEASEWLQELREELPEGSQFLAFEDEGTVRRIPIAEGWTRIGRSVSADIRLNDPTVSRRHALVVRTHQDKLRVLDDRSLNGVFVNGDQVEWSPLVDGDELVVGRFQLHVIDRTADRISA